MKKPRHLPGLVMGVDVFYAGASSGATGAGATGAGAGVILTTVAGVPSNAAFVSA